MLNRFWRAMTCFILALCLPLSAALAQDSNADALPLLEQRAQDIVAAMRGEKPGGDVFNDGFRAAVPDERLLGLTAQLTAQFGMLQGVDSVEPLGPVSARITLRFDNALAIGEFALEPKAPYKVAGFALREFQPIGDNAEKIVADLAALPGVTGALLVRLDTGEILLSHQPDRRFAIGSTFKLYILAAITRDVSEGRTAWDRVVPLEARSFPSGMLQDWPRGSPLTVHSLASLMISISDNTATDQLLTLAGRDEVEAEVVGSGHALPESTFPFLGTREMFVLKGSPPPLGEDYLAADLPTRRAILRSLDLEAVDLETISATFAGGPRLIELEWLASPADLAALLRHLRDMGDPVALDIMAINPGITPDIAARFAYIGYKGGSEPGVLNQSWLLQTQDGTWYALVVSWNNPDASIDDDALVIIARRAMGLLLPPQ